jgi:hypothetical protein
MEGVKEIALDLLTYGATKTFLFVVESGVMYATPTDWVTYTLADALYVYAFKKEGASSTEPELDEIKKTFTIVALQSLQNGLIGRPKFMDVLLSVGASGLTSYLVTDPYFGPRFEKLKFGK